MAYIEISNDKSPFNTHYHGQTKLPQNRQIFS